MSKTHNPCEDSATRAVSEVLRRAEGQDSELSGSDYTDCNIVGLCQLKFEFDWDIFVYISSCPMSRFLIIWW